MNLLANDTILEIGNYLFLVDLINLSRTSKRFISILRSLVNTKAKQFDFEISTINLVRLEDFIYLANSNREYVFELTCEYDAYFLTQFSNKGCLVFKQLEKFSQYIQTRNCEILIKMKLESTSQILEVLTVIKEKNLKVISNEEAYKIMEEFGIRRV